MQAVKKSAIITAAITLFAFCGQKVSAARFAIDPSHSSVEFKVRHLMINKVSGKFDRFTGEFNYDEKNPATWTSLATIDAASVNTGSNDRDNHLRNADFFEVAKFPSISFKSTGISDVKGNVAKLNGILNLHGVEKPVTLDLEIGGTIQDPWGNTRAGFSATGKINRKDFGIIWNKALGNNGLVVGEEVEITIQVEGTQDKAGAPAADKKPAEMKKK